jgi:hypothetical protein
MELRLRRKNETMALGRWPEVSEKEAQAAHTAGHELLRKGGDPMQQRRETTLRTRFQAGASFQVIAKSWIDAQEAHWSAGYLDKIKRRFPNNVYPWLGSRPIAEITAFGVCRGDSSSKTA